MKITLKKVLVIGGVAIGAYVAWRYISLAMAQSNLPDQVKANPSDYRVDIAGGRIDGKGMSGAHWTWTGTAWYPMFTGLLPSPQGNKESAERQYQWLVADAERRTDSATYKKYMPVIRNLIDKGDYKNAEVYSSWLIKPK